MIGTEGILGPTARFFVVSSFRKDKNWYDRCNFAGGYLISY